MNQYSLQNNSTVWESPADPNLYIAESHRRQNNVWGLVGIPEDRNRLIAPLYLIGLLFVVIVVLHLHDPECR